eukprot:TRINITY_DN3251_c0_g1_i3.p1 TRINITY_DN3251_c0_g1~~TRINITY_DN3251_c0_g1_i3.p1  ORF type:complete len:258 (-),score=31.26 TRINITY_DN3251_c0_g1_i3:200-973(-)
MCNMKLLFICCLILHINAEKNENKHEKLVKVWKDRIQHTDLDADEVNFPLFIDEDVNQIGVELANMPSISEKIPYGVENYIVSDNSEDNNSSIITFFHKITTNNVTRSGVTKIPSSSVMPLIKTALGSLSGENAAILALGGLLPLLMLSLPFVVMAVVIPVFLVVGLTMFGVVTSSMFFLPLALFGVGLYAASGSNLDFLTDRVFAFDEFSSFENLPTFEEVENIGDKIEKAFENITIAEEESPFQMNNNSVPRLFF